MPELWTSILHIFASFFPNAALERATMVGREGWRSRRVGYASSMACHCIHYVFIPSPQRYNSDKTNLVSSKRPMTLLLSSFGNNTDSYNTLVSGVYFALPFPLLMDLCNFMMFKALAMLHFLLELKALTCCTHFDFADFAYCSSLFLHSTQTLRKLL